jgi:hypothetical protein
MSEPLIKLTAGDDPYWEAVDLHYWQTNNKEWYHPEQVTTKNGKLILTLDDQPLNGMAYRGGSEFILESC